MTDGSSLSDELCSAFIEALTREEPLKGYADRNFATPNEAYCAMLETAKRTISEDKLQTLLEARGKETLEEALSVEYVFRHLAFAELKERIKKGSRA